jgi:Gas vesicle synthesis protein GvpL/GvpF
MGCLNPHVAQAILVHGICRSDASPELRGEGFVPGGRLAVLRQGHVAAIVNILPSILADGTIATEIFADADRAAQLAIKHNALLTALAVQTDILPVRLGAAYADEAAVRAMLADQENLFVTALGRIGGAVEFAVRMTALTELETEKQPAISDAMSGRGYLKARGAVADRRRQAGEIIATASRRVLIALGHDAVEQAVIKPRRGSPEAVPKRLLDIALLIRRDTLETFAARVVAAQAEAAQSGFKLSVSGPWPAYSFATHAEAES